VTGNSSQANLTGTLYGRYGVANIIGQGTYSAQFIVGSIKISGNGTITINFTGSNEGKSKLVYLVE
jgi:hypothetical protein